MFKRVTVMLLATLLVAGTVFAAPPSVFCGSDAEEIIDFYKTRFPSFANRLEGSESLPVGVPDGARFSSRLGTYVTPFTKPEELQALEAMAVRRASQTRVFLNATLPARYTGTVTYEVQGVRMEIRPIGANDVSLSTQGSIGVYKNGFDDIDVIYNTTPGRCEEFFILRKQQDEFTLEFEVLNADSIALERDEAGNLIITDRASGNRAMIEAPIMIDSAGMPIGHPYARWDWDAQNARLRLKLATKSMIFPVLVDPTLTYAEQAVAGNLTQQVPTVVPNDGWLDVNATIPSATGKMQAGRYGHTATLLDSGCVLIAGGGTTVLEVYDPRSNTFSTVDAALGAELYWHSARMLPTGMVMIVGGFAGRANCWFFNERASWNTTQRVWRAGVMAAPALNAGRHGHATYLSGNSLVVAGGVGGSSIIDSTEVYDWRQRAWATVGPLNKGRAFAAMSVAGGQLVICGGYNPSDGEFGGVLRCAERFAGGGWAQIGDMAQPRMWHSFTGGTVRGGQHTCNAANQGVLAFAGGEALSTTENCNGNEFTAGGNMTAARYGHTATLLWNGATLIAGGFNSGGEGIASAERTGSGTFQNAFYNRTVNMDGTNTNVAMGRGWHTATLLNTRKVLFVGGIQNVSSPAGLPQAALYIEDVSRLAGAPAYISAWYDVSNHQVPRVGHAAKLVPGVGSVISGGMAGTTGNENVPFNCRRDAEAYIVNQPAQPFWTPVFGNMNVARAFHTFNQFVVSFPIGHIDPIWPGRNCNPGAYPTAGGGNFLLQGEHFALDPVYQWLIENGVGGAQEHPEEDPANQRKNDGTPAPGTIPASFAPGTTWTRVMVAGGYSSCGAPLSSTEIYLAGTDPMNRQLPQVYKWPVYKLYQNRGAWDLASGGGWQYNDAVPETDQRHPKNCNVGNMLFRGNAYRGNPRWVNGAFMNTPRARHASINLYSGRIMVAGGVIDKFGTCTASAEIYHPGYIRADNDFNPQMGDPWGCAARQAAGEANCYADAFPAIDYTHLVINARWSQAVCDPTLVGQIRAKLTVLRDAWNAQPNFGETSSYPMRESLGLIYLAFLPENGNPVGPGNPYNEQAFIASDFWYSTGSMVSPRQDFDLLLAKSGNDNASYVYAAGGSNGTIGITGIDRYAEDRGLTNYAIEDNNQWHVLLRTVRCTALQNAVNQSNLFPDQHFSDNGSWNTAVTTQYQHILGTAKRTDNDIIWVVGGADQTTIGGGMGTNNGRKVEIFNARTGLLAEGPELNHDHIASASNFDWFGRLIVCGHRTTASNTYEVIDPSTFYSKIADGGWIETTWAFGDFDASPNSRVLQLWDGGTKTTGGNVIATPGKPPVLYPEKYKNIAPEGVMWAATTASDRYRTPPTMNNVGPTYGGAIEPITHRAEAYRSCFYIAPFPHGAMIFGSESASGMVNSSPVNYGQMFMVLADQNLHYGIPQMNDQDPNPAITRDSGGALGSGNEFMDEQWWLEAIGAIPAAGNRPLSNNFVNGYAPRYLGNIIYGPDDPPVPAPNGNPAGSATGVWSGSHHLARMTPAGIPNGPYAFMKWYQGGISGPFPAATPWLGMAMTVTEWRAKAIKHNSTAAVNVHNTFGQDVIATYPMYPDGTMMNPRLDHVQFDTEFRTGGQPGDGQGSAGSGDGTGRTMTIGDAQLQSGEFNLGGAGSGGMGGLISSLGGFTQHGFGGGVTGTGLVGSILGVNDWRLINNPQGIGSGPVGGVGTGGMANDGRTGGISSGVIGDSFEWNFP